MFHVKHKSIRAGYAQKAWPRSGEAGGRGSGCLVRVPTFAVPFLAGWDKILVQGTVQLRPARNSS